MGVASCIQWTLLLHALPNMHAAAGFTSSKWCMTVRFAARCVDCSLLP